MKDNELTKDLKKMKNPKELIDKLAIVKESVMKIQSKRELTEEDLDEMLALVIEEYKNHYKEENKDE